MREAPTARNSSCCLPLAYPGDASGAAKRLSYCKLGAGEGARTLDPDLGKVRLRSTKQSPRVKFCFTKGMKILYNLLPRSTDEDA